MANSYINEAVKNSYYVLVMSLVGVAIGYALRVFLSKTLSIDEFGLFYAVSAFVGLFTLIRYLGLNQALAKFIPEFLISRENNKIKSSIKTVFVIQTISILIFTAIILIFHNTLSSVLFKSNKASLVLILMTLSFLPSMVFMIFQSVFQGYQKLKVYAWIEPVRISLTFLFSVIFVQIGALGIAVAYLITSAATSLIFLPKFLDLGIMKFKSKLSGELTSKLLRFSTPVFLSSIGFIVINFTDTIVITYFRTLEEVALYQVALPTSQLLIVFSTAITAVIFPLVSYLYSSKKYSEISSGMRVITVLLLLVLIPFVMLLFSFPEIILQFLFSAQFLPAANSLQILSIGMIFYSIFFVFQTAIDGIGKPILNTKIMAVMAAINIFLNILMVPAIGIMGSAAAFLITFLFGALIEYNYVKKYLHVSLPFLRLAKIAAGFIVSAAVIFFLKYYIQLPAIEEFVILLAIGWAIYFGTVIASRAVTKEDITAIESFASLPGFVRKLSRAFRTRGGKQSEAVS